MALVDRALTSYDEEDRKRLERERERRELLSRMGAGRATPTSATSPYCMIYRVGLFHAARAFRRVRARRLTVET